MHLIYILIRLARVLLLLGVRVRRLPSVLHAEEKVKVKKEN